MKERLILSFTEPDFRINHKKKRVRCVVKMSLSGDPKLMTMLKTFERITNDPIDSEITVDVFPTEGDEFVVDTGMRVALARVEKLAYRRASNFLKRFRKFIESYNDMLNNFDDKSQYIIKHNEEYVKTF